MSEKWRRALAARGSASSFRFAQVVMIFALILACSAACADEASVVYYDVSGRSSRQLRSELDAKGPLDKAGERFDGLTSWRVTWTYRYVSDGTGCKFTSMDASVAGTIVLPHWAQEDRASSSAERKWDRYLAALRSHEDGHYALGVAARDEIQKLGESFRVPGACSTIGKTFNGEAEAILARYGALDAKYDQDTEHGKTQGAVFP